jgi:hypothetical protein
MERLTGTKIAIGVQIVALVLAVVAVIGGVIAAYSVALPGPSGEWAALSVIASYAVNVPLGLIGLTVGLAVKEGSPLLSRLCIGFSIAALSLPVLATLLSH